MSRRHDNECIGAIVRALDATAEHHGCMRFIAADPGIGSVMLPGATVAAHIDGAVVTTYSADEDIDFLRVALIARDLHRACGRELALVYRSPAETAPEAG